jgi:hypothetical protein
MVSVLQGAVLDLERTNTEHCATSIWLVGGTSTGLIGRSSALPFLGELQGRRRESTVQQDATSFALSAFSNTAR